MACVETDAESALTLSFRFGDAIADVATRVLKRLGERRPIRGNPAVLSRLDHGKPQALLCRTNAGVLTGVLSELTRGGRPHVLGGVRQLLALLRDVKRLQAGIPAETGELFGFRTWLEVRDFVERHEDIVLRTLVNIVEAHNCTALIAALQKVNEDPRNATLTISTAHKAKGQEWPVVEISPDFVRHTKEGRPALGEAEELRLLYVALTRGKTGLHLPEALFEAIHSDNGRAAPIAVTGRDSSGGRGPVAGARTKVPRPALPPGVRVT